MSNLANLARMTVTGTPGTGTITLNAAVSSYLTFAQAGITDGMLVSYGILDGVNSEAGIGIYTASGTTLSRLRVYNSTNGNAAVSLTSAAEVGVAPLASNIRIPKGYLYGLTLSNNVTDATNDIDIAAGEASDSTGLLVMALASGITKRLDAAWAVGSGNGGLDTGSIANTTYHIHLIMRPDTGVVDVLFSASATAPTMPTNYTYRRRIGSIVRASAAIKSFYQVGDNFNWGVTVQDVNATNPGTSAVTRTLTLPTGIVVEAIVNFDAHAESTNFYGLFTALAVADTTPSASAFTFNAAATGAGITALEQSGQARVLTNTSAQIRTRNSESGASDSLTLITMGWVDARDRT